MAVVGPASLGQRVRMPMYADVLAVGDGAPETKTQSQRLCVCCDGVELRGFEPLTSCMPCKRSTN